MKYFYYIILILHSSLFVTLNGQTPSTQSSNSSEKINPIPNPEYGKCYVKCINQDRMETVTDSILIQPDPEQYPNLQPIYETKTEEILVKKGSFKMVSTPSTFETYKDSIPVEETTLAPNLYETFTHRVQLSPESGKWVILARDFIEKHACLYDKINPSECEIVCFEKVPPTYETITRKEIKSNTKITDDAKINTVYKTIEKSILKKSSALKMIESPAEYQTVSRQVIVAYKNGEELITPKYITTTKKKAKKATNEEEEWSEITCHTGFDMALIKAVQQALKDRGYYEGPINGIDNLSTRRALKNFQIKEGIPVCGGIATSPKLLRALGLK